jgi:AcrR family transcriptional regulator
MVGMRKAGAASADATGAGPAGCALPASPPARRGRTRSADVEQQLLAAAETVLVREGPGGLTVRAVATEAGIAPMGVYNRLGGKDGLVAALLIRGFDMLRAAVEAARDAPSDEGMYARLITCGLGYRQFALDNPHFYAIMFEDAIPHELDNEEVEEHAAAAFYALVRIVEMAAAAGVIAAPDAVEAAMQIWSGVHGAAALELKGLVLTPDAQVTYRAFLVTMIRGLAPR